MAKKNYYEILGIQKSASEKEIKSAYKSKAMKYHPDRNQGNIQAEAKFKEINEAYQVLSNPQTKAQYDQFGSVDPNMRGFSGGGGFEDIFSDIFSDIFTQQQRRNTKQRTVSDIASPGADLAYKIEIDLKKAIKGCKYNISFKTKVNCVNCQGKGTSDKVAQLVNCQECGGAGAIRKSQGFFTVEQTCHACMGQGVKIKSPCNKCGGMGRISGNKRITVKIPAGVSNGDKIRVAGEGEAGIRGGKHGDLFVNVLVKPHEIFTVNDSNLLCEVPINIIIAILGGEVTVPSFEGMMILKVPAGTTDGRILKVKNKGIVTLRNKIKGDLLCKIKLELPAHLTKEQKKVLESFGKVIGDENFPKVERFKQNIDYFISDLD